MGGGRGPKLAALELSQTERDVLQGWVRRSKTAQVLATRARIVLACADGLSNREVSRQLRVSLPTVGKWRKRFVEHRLDGLSDEPLQGAPRKLSDTQVERVITKTLEELPVGGDSRWSTRTMAAATGMSQTAISRIWRAFGLQPHVVDTWKLSTDPLFIDKVRAPTCQHENDLGKDRTIVDRRAPTSLRAGGEARNQRFNDLPQRIRHQPQSQLIYHASHYAPQVTSST